jgi:uncharacterized protein
MDQFIPWKKYLWHYPLKYFICILFLTVLQILIGHHMSKTIMRKKITVVIRWVAWVILVQLILFNTSAALYAYKFTHVYEDVLAPGKKKAVDIFTRTWHLFGGPRQFRALLKNYPLFPCDTIHLTTSDGILIDCWYSHADTLQKGTVILVHGFQSNKGMLLPEAEALREMGYNVFMIDLRAHGNSGGHTTTLGIKEPEEAALAYDYISHHGGKRIFFFGSSMGAVVIARALSEYELKPAGIILEMPYASMRAFCEARLRGMGFVKSGAVPFSFLITLWSGLETDHNGFKHYTPDYCRKIHCPVLMQWGAKDDFAREDDTQRIYRAIASADKKMVIFENAGHESLYTNDPVKWRSELSRFLNNCPR